MKTKFFFILLLIFPLTTFFCFSQTNCNNWLNIPDNISFCQIGDLDIPGTTITVEATFNRISPWNNGLDVFQGDIVSKHIGPTNCNYLLRPSSAEITTTNGYFKTPVICPIELNKTYHVAFVYDGSTLKFYRNGFLMSQTFASGDLFQNDFLTQFGLLDYPPSLSDESLIGFISEVRIWNIARTQQQLQANMSTALTNPSSISGLLAYYTFDNLLNKQGNAAWNGTLIGNAAINSTNTSCNFVVDSCNIISLVCNVKTGNDTTVCEGNSVPLAVTGASSYNWFPSTDLSDPSISNPVATVTSTTTFIVTGITADGCTANDTIVINILPKPVITALNDTTICKNASITLEALGNAQQYQWSPSTGLSNASIPNPVASVSVSTDYIVIGTDVNGCKATDTVAINVIPNPVVKASNDTTICGSSNVTVQLNASGGQQYQWSSSAGLSNASIANPVATVSSTTTYIVVGTDANGCKANDTVTISVLPNPVIIVSKDTSVCQNEKVQLNATGGQQYQWLPSGGLSNTLIPNPVASVATTTTYIVTGSTAKGCKANDTITINILPNPVITTLNDTTICKNASITLQATGGQQYEWLPAAGLNNASLPDPVATVSSPVTYIVTGTAANGCKASDTVNIGISIPPVLNATSDTSLCGNGLLQLTVTGGSSYQWSPATGLNNAGISNPIASINNDITYTVISANANGCSAIDSVKISLLEKPAITLSNDTSVCQNTSLQLMVSGADDYNWSPSEGLNISTIANPVATLDSSHTYIVTATAANGCSAIDSVSILILLPPAINVSNDTAICINGFASLSASGGEQYQWTPATGLSNTTIPNPLASPSDSTQYYVTVTDNNNCKAHDSVLVAVKSKGVFTVNPSSTSVCSGQSVHFQASGGDTYLWSPAVDLSNPGIANPTAYPKNDIQYSVYIKENYCNTDTTLTVFVTVNPTPGITISKENDIDCNHPTTQLQATGSQSYSWKPADGLSNSFISNPVAAISVSTLFYVTATSGEGCKVTDSIQVNVKDNQDFRLYEMPTAFTPNGDGLNDCFGITKWGNVEVERMEIYNRWGQLVFRGKRSSDCWDGKFNSVLQTQGAFAYIIKAKTLCGIVERKGIVVLIR